LINLCSSGTILRTSNHDNYQWVDSKYWEYWAIKPYEIVTLPKPNLIEQSLPLPQLELISPIFSPVQIPEILNSNFTLQSTQSCPPEQTITTAVAVAPQAFAFGKRTREGARLTNLPLEEDAITKKQKISVLGHLPPEVMVAQDTISFLESQPPVVLRPWIALNTQINGSFLSTFKRKLIGLIIHQPGITERKISTDFSVFRPSILKELLDHLEREGLVYSKTIFYEKPSLFSNPANIIYTRLNDPFQSSLCTQLDGNTCLSPHTVSEKCYFAIPGVLGLLGNTLTPDGTDYIDQYSNL